MKYGKGVNAYVKLSIRANGSIKTVVFDYPHNKESFDRVENIFYQFIVWYRTLFPEIDATNLIWSILKFDNDERNKMISYMITGLQNGKLGGKKNANN